MDSPQAPSGFSHLSPLSPGSSNSTAVSYHTLPHPRPSGPLKQGSRSESNLIAYLDEQLLQISRKYAKKYHDSGYNTIKTVVGDLERLVDVLWISSTHILKGLLKATLQIHYLLQMANSFNDYLASFPRQLKPTLRLLDTFDRCFHILITGPPVNPAMPLSPEISVYRMSMTEKVRLKSVAERTRLHVVKLAGGGTATSEPPTEFFQGISSRTMDEVDIGDQDGSVSDLDDLEDEDLEIEVARVYNRSLVELGESLGGNEPI